METTKKEEKKYFCTLEKPLGMEKHIWGIVWMGGAHIFAFFGWRMLLMGHYPLTIVPYYYLYGMLSGLGITVGNHRYWAHKTFKAKLPLQILMMYMQTAMVQLTIFRWCRDHRIHHKYTETDADPHDSRRGFWFSHVGWLLMKEHPSIKEKEKTIDLSDLDNDPIVRFQAKYYWYLVLISAFIVPMSVTSFLFPELSLLKLFLGNCMMYTGTINVTWLVNSAAHKWGYKPCDKNIGARNNWFWEFIGPLGEGWHNHHHTFPWDYKSDGLGPMKFNLSTYFIDFFAWIGWAYDLKSVPENVVRDRVNRTGDGTHPLANGISGSTDSNNLDEKEVLPAWGWGDKDIPLEHCQITKILRPQKSG